MKNTKAFLFIATIAVLIVGFIMYSKANNAYLPNQQSNIRNGSSAIQTPADLNSDFQSLDNTNVNSMDSSLDQINSDATSF